jgi:sugar transferase (PEP-CTERM/EpsH1 system associated)
MKLLVITHRLPCPPHKGEKIRALNILKFLASRHEVHLVSLVDDDNDLRYIDQLQPHVRSLTVQRVHPRLRKAFALSAVASGESVSSRYFHVSALQRRVDALIEREGIAGVFCSSSPTAEYVFRSRHATRLRDVPKVMDLIDVDSVKWRHYAEQSHAGSAWLYRREARYLAALEARIGQQFDRILVVSEAERTCCDSVSPDRVTAVPNGVDLEYFSPRAIESAERQPPTLVFTGVMDYRPNVDGVAWFVRSILPSIRAAVPDVRLFIVGNRPSKTVQRLASDPGVIVTGFVPDVREYVARGVSIAPLRIARGIQNKVLEAMAMGRPIVVTPQAFEGIDAVPGRDLMVAADEHEFAARTIECLQDPGHAGRLGKAARARAEQRYSWSKNLALLDELLPATGRVPAPVVVQHTQQPLPADAVSRAS